MPPETDNGVSERHDDVEHDGSTAASEETPEKKRKRRRRRRGRKPPAATAEDAATPVQPESSGAPSPASAGAIAALAGGFLSHIDDRLVPCAGDGCDNTWVWTAAEQIQAFGQPPPRRLCEACQSVYDTEVVCSVDGCKRTWTWTRDAQLKHRAWVKRNEQQPGAGSRRGKRRRADSTPRRKCDLCQAKLARLTEQVSECKVHGCNNEVVIDRDMQLRAWAALHTDDLDASAPLPKRMCDSCRDFCRAHPDREIKCARPGCHNVWMYKTGAQLQAHLAGRHDEPMRLCAECAKAELAGLKTVDGAEVMPCVVLGCDGTWLWRPEMTIEPAAEGSLPVDRMCDTHRHAFGAEARPSALGGESIKETETPLEKPLQTDEQSDEASTVEEVGLASSD